MSWLYITNKLKINQMLFFSHLLLVLFLIATLSYSRYQSEWNTGIAHAFENAHSVSNPIIDRVSPAAAGLNYTNIKLDTALGLYAATSRLVYFEVSAQSDFSESNFAFAYEKESGKIWQTNLDYKDISAQQDLIMDLRKRVVQHPEQQVKLKFLLERANERLSRLQRDLYLTETKQQQFALPELQDGEYSLDSRHECLVLRLPLRNQNGGSIWLVFDARSLFELRNEIIHQLWFEALVALLLSTLLILWVSRWIVHPLKKLTEHINRDIADVDARKVPGFRRRDEIGVLSRRFQSLVKRSQLQMKELEEKSAVDPLTRLGSRFKYQTIAENYLKQTRRGHRCMGFLIADLDFFKNYNDTLGHPKGDQVLKQTGEVIKKTLLRETDMPFRLGGEEFVVLLQTAELPQVHKIAQRIVEAISSQNIIHPSHPSSAVVTVSIGSVAISPLDLVDIESMQQVYEIADQALYRAKAKGRNCVEQLNWSELENLQGLVSEQSTETNTFMD